MGLFKRKQKADAPAGRGILAEKLSGFYTKLQSGWAGWMAVRTAPLSKKDWVIALGFLVVVMGGYSTYLLISGFTGTKATVFAVGTIHRPAFTGKTGELPKAEITVSEQQYKRIKRFHSYMDSLAASPSGKRAYDSLLRKRPGLMDSLKQAEQYYQQLKHK